MVTREAMQTARYVRIGKTGTTVWCVVSLVHGWLDDPGVKLRTKRTTRYVRMSDVREIVS